jgi:hypothetical protein
MHGQKKKKNKCAVFISFKKDTLRSESISFAFFLLNGRNSVYFIIRYFSNAIFRINTSGEYQTALLPTCSKNRQH